MSGEGRLRICEDAESLAWAAAALFVQRAEEAVAARGRCAVALAGGSTPRRAYELLAGEPHAGSVPWSHLHLFWGDERCLPAGDPQRNETMVRRALLDHVAVPPEQVHAIDCAGSPEVAATAYGDRIATFFDGQPPCFDLVLLGLGEDGHIASLLPGLATLMATDRWTGVARRAEEDFDRVTLTAPLFNQARLVVFLVSGRSKARVVRAALRGEGSLPVDLIRPVAGEVLWLIDREAASLLEADDGG